MLTVIVGLDGSGNSSTLSPFGSRYSVMPSTEATGCSLTGGVAVRGRAALAGASPPRGWASAAGLRAGGASACAPATVLAGTMTVSSRPSALGIVRRIETSKEAYASGSLRPREARVEPAGRIGSF